MANNISPLSGLCRSRSRSRSRSLSVDPSEVMNGDAVELHCIPMETHFCPVPKLLMATPVGLNSVSLARHPS